MRDILGEGSIKSQDSNKGGLPVKSVAMVTVSILTIPGHVTYFKK